MEHFVFSILLGSSFPFIVFYTLSVVDLRLAVAYAVTDHGRWSRSVYPELRCG